MDELIQAMSIAELKTFRVQYQSNESIVKILDGYIEVKEREEAEAKARADFAKAIGKLTEKLPHPEDIHNVYLVWREVDVEDTSQEAEMVDIVVKVAEMDGDGRITEPAVIEPQPRYPTTKVNMWVVELNKGFQVVKATNGTPSTTKRAITLHKRSGTQLVPIGNFPSASKACEYLKIVIGGDSATRVLNREGYILDAYTGSDYTS